jgi:prepilin-type N-terminal cleavage/methylation domain-containing protein
MSKAFTLIELLLSITVMVVLSAVVIAIVNPTSKQQQARDGVKMEFIKRLSTAIESYRMAEGSYPADTDIPVSPDTTNSSILMTNYIKQWPAADPNAYVYHNLGTAFSLYVNKEFVPNTSAANCFKYNSGWRNVRECRNPNCVATNNGC